MLWRAIYGAPTARDHATAYCALMDNNQIKCWGYLERFGRLRVYSADGTVYTGDASTEMGNNLTQLSWGPPGTYVQTMCIGKWVHNIVTRPASIVTAELTSYYT